MVRQISSANYPSDQRARRITWFRIAFPAWRFVGIRSAKTSAAEAKRLTREELQSLFSNDLTQPNAAVLTETEIAAQEEATRLRQALYSPLNV
ncbi:hypothetical protein [Phaeovulum sp.]|uniref:hypothetical protein n=1 Tax=Phaeovulum sp. TaxID=2934796 RepID=UPI0039E722C3